MALFPSSIFRRSALTTVLIGFAVVCAVAAANLHYPKLLERIELDAADVLIYHGTRPRPTDRVVIAAIDDKSIAALGRWPWSRDVEARLTRALADYHVAVVGFDLLLSEPDSADVERARIVAGLRRDGIDHPALALMAARSNDRDLAAALTQQGHVFLGYSFSSHQLHSLRGRDLTGYRTAFEPPAPVAYNIVRVAPGARDRTLIAEAYLPPVPLLNQAARGTAYVDIDADTDGEARSYPTVIRFNGRYCVPLFLALADAYANYPPLRLDLAATGVSSIALGNRPIPVDELGRMMIHFRGGAGTLPVYSVADIVTHRVAPAALAGRIVIVGVTGHALGDRLVTPMGGDFPGVEVQATAVDNVLAGDFLIRNKTLWYEEQFAGFVMGAAVSLAAALLSAVWSAAVALALAAGYLAFSDWMLTERGAVLGIVFPLLTLALTYLAVVSWRYITEGSEKRFLRTAFEHYLHPDVIASIVNDPSGFKLGGERRHLSILFADIMGFTSRAERSAPEPLVAMLNVYMTAMTDLILKADGVVDKLMGDGIMAFWGAPAAHPNPARAATDCGLAMLAELRRLALRDQRFADLRIGVGIATGEVVVGNVGGERRFDYSVIGDTVNLASRIEGLTRRFNVDLLVDGATLAEAGAGFVTRAIGRVRVKGKDQAVPLVEIAGREGDGIDPAFYQRFADASTSLARGASPAAALRVLQAERPGDQVIAMWLERLSQTDEGEPPAEMVFEFDVK